MSVMGVGGKDLWDSDEGEPITVHAGGEVGGSGTVGAESIWGFGAAVGSGRVDNPSCGRLSLCADGASSCHWRNPSPQPLGEGVCSYLGCSNRVQPELQSIFLEGWARQKWGMLGCQKASLWAQMIGVACKYSFTRLNPNNLGLKLSLKHWRFPLLAIFLTIWSSVNSCS